MPPPSAAVIDADGAVAVRGGLAAQLRGPLAERVRERELSLLMRAIREWHGGTLTGDNARAYVAALAELRGLLADLDREVRIGREAHDRLTTTTPSPAGTAR